MDEKKKSNGLRQIINYALFIFLTVVCILLTVQNRNLKHQLSVTTSLGTVEPLRPGERVESFGVQTLDGNSTVLTLDDSTKKYIFFVFSTSCPHCERTLPVWNSIAKNKYKNCNIFGISMQNLEETKKFLENKNVAFYTLSASIDTSFNRKYKIGGVPETILMSGGGTVAKVWIGELSSEQRREIEELVGI